MAFRWTCRFHQRTPRFTNIWIEEDEIPRVRYAVPPDRALCARKEFQAVRSMDIKSHKSGLVVVGALGASLYFVLADTRASILITFTRVPF